ncbi:MAG: sugar transferase [Ignavibacteriales bacterium]
MEIIQDKISNKSYELNYEMYLQTRETSTFYEVAKRIIDISLSAILLIFLSPLLIIVALMIKIDSPGPVIFKQTRVGRNQELFTIYKFRTMVNMADILYKDIIEKKIKDKKMIEKSNDVKCNDFRVTRVGKLLRKLSIDEIPQFINVIKGDMSLVGPRPNLSYELEQFDKEWYKVRYNALPGISGLWQVSGRNALPFERMMELDYEYVMKRSVLLDLKIILKTVPTVLRWYETR